MSRAPILAWTMLAVLVMPVQAADTHAPDPFSREQIEQQLQKAQERLDQAAHEVADLSTKLNNQFSFDMQPWMRHNSPRAVLGINIGSPVLGAPRVTDGVQILSVSPGGPADIAGLKANDVIVSFGGKELRSHERHSPQQVLSALMFDAKADEPVTVEYRRDGQLQKTQIVPKPLPTFLAEYVERKLQGLGEKFDNLNLKKLDLSGFGSAELLNLSPALGKYFGTDKGLLVVHAPRDERLKLQDGDVILDIDGRVPNGASHALRILNSYRVGEKLKIHIIRQQKHIELPIEIFDDPKMSWVVH